MARRSGVTEDFEKLGVFYLGKSLQANSAEPSQSLLLYESKDLLTHGVCVGMTGSGKTGLCLGLLEEAAIDSIPVIAIDPKGDLGNLLLAFPDLKKEDFLPWVNADEARREQISVDQLAQSKADLWRQGLAQWGQDGGRIAKFKDACDFAIYTPGSSAGLSVSILSSLEAPGADFIDDGDLMRERVNSVATCLLTLLGIAADPLKSREHILLSTIIDRAWRGGKDLDLQELIQEIQAPSIKRIGALDIETFFPQKERMAFALSLNNLLAAPGFEAWLEGEPLNIDTLLFSDKGKPRVSIFSIAHLNDTERMFFVTLLLNQILSWIRTQPGSASLRAILYMDEIYGYFPPVANPPSKMPLLTLLKQARAYGLGILLASQNSVDLDYKGLANAGTWFIGRLQTERDKQRLMDGLEGAAAEGGKPINRKDLELMLGRIKARTFLMNNVHEDRPELFETRWTLSYLFGPLARNQIKSLMAERKAVKAKEPSRKNLEFGDNAQSPPPVTASKPGAENQGAENGDSSSAVSGLTASGTKGNRAPSSVTGNGPAVATQADLKKTSSRDRLISAPLLSGALSQKFLPPGKEPTGKRPIVYRACMFAAVSLRFTDQKANLDTTIQKSFVLPIKDSLQAIDWDDLGQVSIAIDHLADSPLPSASFSVPPSAMNKDSNQKAWRRELTHWLAANQKFYLLRSATNNQFSLPSETERDFRVRLIQVAAQGRDVSVQKLKEKYAPKLATLEQRIRQAQAQAEQAQIAVRENQVGAAIEIGASVLGAFMGRKGISAGSINKARAAAKDMTRAAGKTKAAARTGETLQVLEQQLTALDSEFRLEMSKLEHKYNPVNEAFEPVAFTPKPTNVLVQVFTPVWAPCVEDESGLVTPIWR
jgi:hypothetical protein